MRICINYKVFANVFKLFINTICRRTNNVNPVKSQSCTIWKLLYNFNHAAYFQYSFTGPYINFQSNTNNDVYSGFSFNISTKKCICDTDNTFTLYTLI